jgi:hypothetical protein
MRLAVLVLVVVWVALVVVLKVLNKKIKHPELGLKLSSNWPLDSYLAVPGFFQRDNHLKTITDL